METSWLIERLDNPTLLKKGDEQRLRELIAAYPYFPAPYLLLAKTLKEQNHPAFDQLLPLISLQAFDRKRLFRLIHEEEVKVKVEVEEDVEGMRGLGDEGMTGVEETEPRFAVDFSEVEKTEEEPVQVHQELLHEIPFLMDEVVGAENFLPVSTIEEYPKRQGDVETRGLEDVEEKNITRHPEEANVLSDLEETPRRVEGPDRIDFIQWLEKLQPLKTMDHRPWTIDHSPEPLTPNPETLPAEALAKEGKTRNISRHPEQANDLSDLKEISRRVEGPNPDSLIDKFIETNPSVSRVRERFYDPAVQAKESERIDDSLMTETLARIFVKQEKYERALEAYKKLQLKYPEKSDYFAALIAEINSKIN